MIRHGESTGNREGRLQGQMEFDLSEVGRQQVQKLAQRFVVDDAYDETLEVDLVEGRWFEEQDELKAKAPFILTENLATELFPEGSAVGKKLRFGDNEEDYREIVGVVSDFRYRGGIMETGYGFFMITKWEWGKMLQIPISI